MKRSCTSLLIALDLLEGVRNKVFEFAKGAGCIRVVSVRRLLRLRRQNRSPGEGIAGYIGKRLPETPFGLRLGFLDGDLVLDLHVSTRAEGAPGHTLLGDRHDVVVLCPRRDLEPDLLAVHGGDRDDAAQGRSGDGDVLSEPDVVFVLDLEARVLVDADAQQHVASRETHGVLHGWIHGDVRVRALARDADHVAVLQAVGQVDLDRVVLVQAGALAVAGGAGVGVAHDRALAAALVAGGGHLEAGANVHAGARAGAAGAGGPGGAGLEAGAVAGATGVVGAELEVHVLGAEHGVLEGDAMRELDGAALVLAEHGAAGARAGAAGTRAAAERRAEEVFEVDAAEARASETAKAAEALSTGAASAAAGRAGTALREGRGPELVPLLALGVIREDFVGVLQVVELFLGVLGLVDVGVVLLGELVVGFFDLGPAGGLADTQGRVGILELVEQARGRVEKPGAGAGGEPGRERPGVAQTQ